MEAHEPGHPDVSDGPVITGDRLFRDRSTGRVVRADDWIAERMHAESRDRDICLEELVNAIARGDLEAL
jgi:hypothetical protein